MKKIELKISGIYISTMVQTTMTVTSQYKDLAEFLAKHTTKATTSGASQPTHTRIPDKELNIYGGAYIIPKEELATFHQLYSHHIFTNKRREYLTEKQLENGVGPMVVDFDFRYNHSVEQRIHTQEHVLDMVLLYLEELKEHYTFIANTPFDVFIFEKPGVNRLSDGSLTKDGIHMLIGVQVDHTVQQMIRDKMLTKLPEVWADLPLINDWASVLDEGISKGVTNWQLFGSRKPGNDAYELTQHYNISLDGSDGEFMTTEVDTAKFDFKRDFVRLSVQNDANPKFAMNPKIVDAYNKRAQVKKMKKPVSKTKVNLLLIDDDGDENESNQMSLSDIVDEASLDKAIEMMLASLKTIDYEIKETHMYAQTLPAKYYEPGSHLLNRKVAFALKHTDERLFLSWIKLRSKADDFDYGEIAKLYNEWKYYFKNNKDTSITRRSIMFWSKQDAFEEYEKVKANTIDYFIEETINSQTEFDLAQVLKQMFKDKYVCVSYATKGGVWYVFKNHRWEPDKGLSLRLAISKEMHTLYANKVEDMQKEMNHYPDDDDRSAYIQKKVANLAGLCLKLKHTNDKNNIMREAMELFYDSEFIKNMDNNHYLLCFNNGVVDFNNKVFRDGYPQDYITKTTGINYLAYSPDNPETKKIGGEILDFMEKLFPIPELNRYMWDHLASCLIGTNKNQTFNVYHGSGSNGKSILADLMSVTLGDYKGTVPITLVTEKRGSIGGTSSEVAQLKGVRYAVMQEPSKGVKLNEGTMKELTGGDSLQARALYCESETFLPQFKLVVCTNNLFDIQSNDDGTWRRIRKCDFVAKFIDDGEAHTDDTPYVFPKDKALKEKLPSFAPVFASMLVMRAFQTDGVVKDCDYVMAASNKYRNGQDHISAFVADMVIKTGVPTDKIKKTAVTNAFKFWFQQEQGNAKQPKGKELHDYMDKIYGACGATGWSGVKMKEPDNEDEVVELEHA
jgi:P4 family phage/plasmid primase-like protien